MKIKYLFILILFFILTGNTAFAQIQHKVALNGSIGLSKLPDDRNLTTTGKAQNIFADYPYAPTFNGSIYYLYHLNFSFGANLHYMRANNDKMTINNAAIGGTGKFNIVESDKTFSPYVLGNLNMSFTSIIQKQHANVVRPSQSYSVKKESTDIAVKRYENRESFKNLFFVPSFGFNAGAGIDFRLNANIELFLQYNYNFTFNKNVKLINNTFPDNKNNLKYSSLTTGIRANIF